MTLDQIIAIAADTTFQQQVETAAVHQALVVLNEAVPANTIVETLRQQLATSTITDGCAANLPRFVWAIANSNAGTFTLNDTTDQNDAMIQSAMGNLWSDIALVTNLQTAQVQGV
jgi:hypothetical protein